MAKRVRCQPHWWLGVTSQNGHWSTQIQKSALHETSLDIRNVSFRAGKASVAKLKSSGRSFKKELLR